MRRFKPRPKLALQFRRYLADQMRGYDVAVNSIAPSDTGTKRFVGTREVDPERLVTEGTLGRIAAVGEVARVSNSSSGR